MKINTFTLIISLFNPINSKLCTKRFFNPPQNIEAFPVVFCHTIVVFQQNTKDLAYLTSSKNWRIYKDFKQATHLEVTHSIDVTIYQAKQLHFSIIPFKTWNHEKRRNKHPFAIGGIKRRTGTSGKQSWNRDFFTRKRQQQV